MPPLRSWRAPWPSAPPGPHSVLCVRPCAPAILSADRARPGPRSSYSATLTTPTSSCQLPLERIHFRGSHGDQEPLATDARVLHCAGARPVAWCVIGRTRRRWTRCRWTRRRWTKTGSSSGPDLPPRASRPVRNPELHFECLGYAHSLDDQLPEHYGPESVDAPGHLPACGFRRARRARAGHP